jgi:LDH2 family malate/lactate/ureidoglycolate dehydrogenase
MVEVLSSAVTGMPYCAQVLGMGGAGLLGAAAPGAVHLVIDPKRFVGVDTYNTAMTGYLAAVRAVPAVNGAKVMSPSEREWATHRQRPANGVPIFATLRGVFERLAAEAACPLPVVTRA